MYFQKKPRAIFLTTYLLQNLANLTNAHEEVETILHNLEPGKNISTAMIIWGRDDT